jgi:aspartate/methionine/tyrosine aminotransferase
MPQGAFYLFPNFEVYRERLARKGIYTSFKMCSTLLEETGIAILPGCEFGRDSSELTARIAFVDFDGEAALKAANKEYLNKEINKFFIHTYAPDLVNALKRLAGWLSSL